MEKKIICEFCDKSFTRTYGLTCHLKKCKKRKNQELVIEEKNNEIQELKKYIEKLLIEKEIQLLQIIILIQQIIIQLIILLFIIMVMKIQNILQVTIY